jgi:hypothetical protein
MSKKCQKCWNFHEGENKICEKYKNVLFSCTRCNFCTRGIKNINNHFQSCNGLEKEFKEEIYIDLFTQLQMEKIKNNIYKNLIERNTNIILDNIISCKNDGIHIYNTKLGDFSIFLHEEQNLPILYDKKEEEPENRKKPVKFKNIIKTEIKESLIKNEKTLNFDEILANMEKLKKQFDSLQNVEQIFEEHFNLLKTSRVYSKSLTIIKDKRWSVIGNMKYQDYEKLLSSHVSRCENIFSNKGYTTKKVQENILKSLNPIESRILGYGNYTQEYIDIDDIETFGTFLKLNLESTREYKPFEINNLINILKNYSLALFQISINISRSLFNVYNVNNVIYIPFIKSQDDDPYSFYVLDKVVKEKRYWKQDTRLEQLSQNIIDVLLPYCISLFRRIYFDIFSHNDFILNYESKNQMTSSDCEQLLQNIFILGRPKEFCNLVRKLVKEESTFIPTENDKINLSSDDVIQKKRFKDKEEIDIVDIIRQIFDNITSEQAVDFYRKKESNRFNNYPLNE